MCRVLRVHFSGISAWLKDPLSHRAQEDVRQTALIRQAWTEAAGFTATASWLMICATWERRFPRTGPRGWHRAPGSRRRSATGGVPAAMEASRPLLRRTGGNSSFRPQSWTRRG